MNIRKAIKIFENISSNQYTDEEKVIAIYEVMNMPTHMSIKKETILNALNWLWHSAYEVETEEKETVGAEQTCNDCLHSEICLEQYKGLNQEMMFKECKRFVNKVDVVKVVRCGQCGNYCKNTGECNLYGRHPNENDFCSSGVLKELGK